MKYLSNIWANIHNQEFKTVLVCSFKNERPYISINKLSEKCTQSQQNKIFIMLERTFRIYIDIYIVT